LLQVLRHGALAVEHHRAHLAEDHVDGKAGSRHKRWATLDRSNRFGHLAVAHGVRCSQVEGAGSLLVVDQKLDGAHLVLPMNPRHPLLAVAQGTAGEEVEGHDQLGEGAAFVAEHDAGANHGAAHTQTTCRCGGQLPVEADLGEKVGAGRILLADQRVPGLGAIVAHRGRLDQHLRFDRCGLDRGHHSFARVDAALANRLLARAAPAAIGDAFAGQVDDGMGAVGQFTPPGCTFAVPRLQTDARRHVLDLLRIAGQHDHFVARGDERLAQRAAN
jgi:hypothetical protein